MTTFTSVVSTIPPSTNDFYLTLFVEELSFGIAPGSKQEGIFQELLFLGGKNLYNFTDSFNSCFHNFECFSFIFHYKGTVNLRNRQENLEKIFSFYEDFSKTIV